MLRNARTDNGLLVVKLGGGEGNAWEGLLGDLTRLRKERVPVLLVHGGSAETDRLAAALGCPRETLRSPGGQVSRRTDRRTLEVFAQATALVNRRLVEAARGRGIDAFGLSGLDGGCIRARRKAVVRTVVAGRPVIVRDQWTGKITGVREDLFRSLLDSGLVPVVAPLAVSDCGEMLNVDGDRLAAAMAVAMGADRLVILSNVEGLRRVSSEPATLVGRVFADELSVAGGWAEGRMKKKILGIEEALAGRVPTAIVATSLGENPLQSALEGGGTHFLGVRERGNGP